MGKVEAQQSIEARRVAVANAYRIAELPHAGSPVSTAAERNVVPAHAEIIHKSVANGSGPIAYGVVNRRRSIAVTQQRDRVRRWIVLVGPAKATRNAVLARGFVIDPEIALVHIFGVTDGIKGVLLQAGTRDHCRIQRGGEQVARDRADHRCRNSVERKYLPSRSRSRGRSARSAKGCAGVIELNVPAAACRTFSSRVKSGCAQRAKIARALSSREDRLGAR